MFRIRTILIIVAIIWIVYLLLPAEKKTRVLGKLREVARATTIAIILYWIFMLAYAAWNYWGE
jgi:hypothetical protein